MENRYLGRSGLRVSELCLGTMSFGRETTEADSARICDEFVDRGGNFIDTANGYGRGTSEQIVGNWLAGKPREQMVVATKVFFPMGEGENDRGVSRTHILSAVDASLRRLKTDYIDLYQVHCWDNGTPIEETLSTLDQLVKIGKVRYLGLSNFTGWQLQKAVDTCRHNGWEVPITLQPEYNLLCRSTEWELLPVCRAEGLGVLCWSPLFGGWLAGGYRRGMSAPSAGSRIERATQQDRLESWTHNNNEHTWRVLDALFAVSAEVGKTPAQVALNWILRQPGITAPIVGARAIEHLRENLDASGWELSAEHLAILGAASDVPLPYPYEFVQRMRRP